MPEGSTDRSSDGTQPLYAISVAAELAGIPIPTLRLYERHGLVEPARTDGGTRRYSEADLSRIVRVTALVGDGMNLTAVARLLELEDDKARLELRVDRLTTHNNRLRARNADLRRRQDPRRLREDDGSS